VTSVLPTMQIQLLSVTRTGIFWNQEHSERWSRTSWASNARPIRTCADRLADGPSAVYTRVGQTDPALEIRFCPRAVASYAGAACVSGRTGVAVSRSMSGSHHLKRLPTSPSTVSLASTRSTIYRATAVVYTIFGSRGTPVPSWWDRNVAWAAYRRTQYWFNRTERYVDYLDDLKALKLESAVHERVRTFIPAAGILRTNEFALFHLGISDPKPPSAKKQKG
jgi:hypothetical protein